MKIFYFILTFFLVHSTLFAQIDTSNWYPLQIGNKWFYSVGDIGYPATSVTEVISDTVMPNGKTYFVLKNGYPNYVRNENNQFVYTYNPADSSEYIVYDFISADSTFWKIPESNPYGYENVYWGIQTTKNEYNYYLKKYTQWKLFDWVMIDSSQNPVDTVWGALVDIWPVKVTQGLGRSSGLFAAIINGDTLGNLPVTLSDKKIAPTFRLYQNYPNPFNPSTTIKYQLNAKSDVQLSVYNISGKLIEFIVRKGQSAGGQSVYLNTSGWPSGIYIYSLKAGSFKQSRKMLLIR